MRIATATLVILVLSLASALAGKKADGDLKKIQGTWKIVELKVMGKARPKDKIPKQLVVKDKKLTGIGPSFTIKLDSSKKPKWLDLAFKKNGKLRAIRCIYELNKDELRICMPLARVDRPFKNIRPGSFETKGKDVALFIAKKATK